MSRQFIKVNNQKSKIKKILGLWLGSFLFIGIGEMAANFSDQLFIAQAQPISQHSTPSPDDQLAKAVQLYKSGQYQEAIQSFQAVLIIYQKMGDRQGESITFMGLGTVYNSLGKYYQAEQYYQKALTAFRDINDQYSQGLILSNLGLLYKSMGQYEQAVESFQQALIIARENKNRSAESIALNNLGLVYHALGVYPQAEQFYRQSPTMTQELHDLEGQGRTLQNLGAVYERMEKHEQAEQTLKEALEIAKKIGDLKVEQAVLSNLALLYLNQGKYQESEKLYQQALSISQKIGDLENEGIILSSLGLLYTKQKRFDQAEKSVFSSIEVREKLRPGLTDAQKISLFDIQGGTYEFLQEILIEQNKVTAALEIAERGRARAFVELLAQKLSETPETQLTIQPPTVAQIQKIAKEHNATLVQYSINTDEFKVGNKKDWKESQLYIWVIKPTGEIIFRTVDLKPLWQKQNISLVLLVSNTRQNIGARGLGLVSRPNVVQNNQPESLQTLHQLLIEPIADALPANPSERVIFIPQSELFLVPFAALQDQKGNYLIDRHTILIAPSIQVLELTQKQRQQVETQNSSSPLIVGNPTMPAVVLVPGEPAVSLESLPGAETEAKEIATLLNVQPLIRDQATETMVKHQMSTAKLIHLATHGIIEDLGFGIPGAIALTPSGKDDGLLTADEIFDLPLQAELVVLSACNTGRGYISGDGVIGLSRSFISAGTPSVLVSLWSVPDSPTAELMTQFYRNLQTQPDKAQALRQAMLSTKEKYPNPIDWAAFTLIGEAE
jgi:CHAT domain-containing protein/Tfp pilus assembly protein PilF